MSIVKMANWYQEEKNLLKFKTLKYTIDDMCCDYCYRGLVMDLFENKKIKSVKSNYNYKMLAFNIEFIIVWQLCF